MESLFENLISAAPSAAAMLASFFAFLRYLAKRDDALKEIASSCHAVQERATDALLKNAKESAKCGIALDRVNTTLIRINGGQ